MLIYTLDRTYIEQELIDDFESAIWTDRYKGDGDFQIQLAATTKNLQKLPKGQLLKHQDSFEPMILETRDIKDGSLTVTGITLTKWLNNRIVRTSANHADKEWTWTAIEPGVAMISLVEGWAMDSPYLNGTIDIGIPVGITSQFPIPGLGIGATDTTGPAINITLPFGQLYDLLKSLADTYEIGMRIILTNDVYPIKFESYRGADRTSAQNINPVVQFSKDMNSFEEIHDFESLEDTKTLTIIFGSGHADLVGVTPGYGQRSSGTGLGLDLRILQNWADDITNEQDGGVVATLNNLLTQRALSEIQKFPPVQLVDGQIIEVEGVKYGENFYLGDLVEVVGNTGVLQTARVTEYIRSQDATGERSYPGLTFIE